MALIIKGDMPKGCILDCHYFGVNKYYDERDGKTHKCVYCALNDNIRYKDCGFPDEYEHTRHPNCPIKGEIPDKHGDLTERSLILDKVKDKWSKIYEEKGYDVMSDFWLALCEVIDCAPVILEANK